jgi:predicted nucleic acid-binding protein
MDIFKRCAAGNELNILLLKELNRGEAEAIVQAQEIGATFLIADERPAREIGERHGLRSVGTLRLIARLHLEGYAGEPRALIEKLRRDVKFRIAEDVIREALAKAHEPI